MKRLLLLILILLFVSCEYETDNTINIDYITHSIMLAYEKGLNHGMTMAKENKQIYTNEKYRDRFIMMMKCNFSNEVFNEIANN